MSALAAMRRLERLAAHLVRGEPLAPADGAAIGAGIMAWLDGREPYRARSLYDALGLALAAGENDPRQDRRAERCEALLLAAMELMPGAKRTVRARELHEHASRYFSGARWRADRVLASCPYADGTLAALVWQALKLRPAVPSVETLRRLGDDVVAKSPLFVTSAAGETGSARTNHQDQEVSYGDVERSSSDGSRSSAGARGGCGSPPTLDAGAGTAGRADRGIPGEKQRR